MDVGGRPLPFVIQTSVASSLKVCACDRRNMVLSLCPKKFSLWMMVASVRWGQEEVIIAAKKWEREKERN